MSRRFVVFGVCTALFGCAGSNQCRKGPGDDVRMAARTTGASVKTGATTAVEGIKTFGRATGGLFKGGKEGARREWKKGAAKTDKVSGEGAADIRRESSKPRCR